MCVYVNKAIIVIPNQDASIQDLGAFRSSVLMETDILPGSAVLCRMGEDGELKTTNGSVHMSFEGNAYDTWGLDIFSGRAEVAASRLVTSYPSIAYGTASPDSLLTVGTYDLLRRVILTIGDMDAICKWTGEGPESILPTPAESGSRDPAELKRLMAAGPTRTYLCPPMICALVNGQIYYQTDKGIHGAIYDHDDPVLTRMLKIDGIPDDVRERVCPTGVQRP